MEKDRPYFLLSARLATRIRVVGRFVYGGAGELNYRRIASKETSPAKKKQELHSSTGSNKYTVYIYIRQCMCVPPLPCLALPARDGGEGEVRGGPCIGQVYAC